MVWYHKFLVSITTSSPYVRHLQHCSLAGNTIKIMVTTACFLKYDRGTQEMSDWVKVITSANPSQ